MAARIWQQLTLLLWAATMAAATYPRLEIHRYFLNQSLVNRQYVCSKQERECFRSNQLLHKADGKCYSVGERGPCAAGQLFHADGAEATRKAGHLRGVCVSPCAGAGTLRLAATGQCLTKGEVESQICRKDWYMRPAIDAFGQWVCEWTQMLCTPPERPTSTYYFVGDYNGLCTAPDLLRNWTSDGPRATVPAEKPKDHPWLQYFTNKTYLDLEYPCTAEEEACLRYGRVLNSDGNCSVPGQWSDKCEPGETFHIDWDALKEDRLEGTCKSICKDYKMPQTVSGECVDWNGMSEICPWDWGMQVEQNAFGQFACTCSWSPTAPPTPQPTLPPPASSPGRCRAPDFSNPVRAPSYDMTLTVGAHFICSEDEFACLQKGRVWTSGECHELRTRGPCAVGQELVLDKEKLAHERLVAVCKKRPCPEGSVRLPIDDRCLTHEKMLTLLCPGQQVALDEFGNWQCDYDGSRPANFNNTVRNASDGTCDLAEKYGAVPVDPVIYNSTGPDNVTMYNDTMPNEI